MTETVWSSRPEMFTIGLSQIVLPISALYSLLRHDDVKSHFLHLTDNETEAHRGQIISWQFHGD